GTTPAGALRADPPHKGEGKTEFAARNDFTSEYALIREPQHRIEQHRGASLEVLGRGIFLHIVAQSADARHEDHARRAEPCHHLRVVAGAGEKPAAGKGELSRRRFDEGYHLARKGGRL